MSETLTLVSPVDGRIVAERPLATAREIKRAFAAAREAQGEWRRLPVAERAACCSRAVDAMLAMGEEIVPELAWQMGRPVRHGRGELRGFEERARYMIDIAETALGRVVPRQKDGFKLYMEREPLGVVFVVAPWNYPYLTAVNTVVPALMAGNAVVLKHARQTLLVGERFQHAFDAAGLPDGLFRNLVLSHAQTAEIVASRQANMVAFTGSVEGGAAIERAAAGTFIHVGLELGGKDPAYVRADADLAHAVENLVDGAYFNSGQSCCAVERIYVQARAFDSFVDGFVHLTNGYVLGDPLDEATTLGPMVDAGAADFVRGQVEAAIRAGAQAHVDESRFPASRSGTPYLAPQALTRVDHQMAVMREESFGPVIGIVRVADDAEAVALMNDSPFGLTASVWTQDLEAAEALGRRLETGTVYMNRCDYLDPALAWTGVKNSGRGVTLSAIGYEHLTRPKSYHLRTRVGG